MCVCTCIFGRRTRGAGACSGVLRTEYSMHIAGVPAADDPICLPACLPVCCSTYIYSCLLQSSRSSYVWPRPADLQPPGRRFGPLLLQCNTCRAYTAVSSPACQYNQLAALLSQSMAAVGWLPQPRVGRLYIHTTVYTRLVHTTHPALVAVCLFANTESSNSPPVLVCGGGDSNTARLPDHASANPETHL